MARKRKTFRLPMTYTFPSTLHERLIREAERKGSNRSRRAEHLIELGEAAEKHNWHPPEQEAR